MSRLLWLDLETTGSDPTEDYVLELGFVVTDNSPNFVPQPLPQYTADVGSNYVLLPSLPQWGRHMYPVPQACRRLAEERAARIPDIWNMHSTSGLWDDIKNAELTISELDEHLREMVVANGLTDSPLVLAGSGVGPFDLSFVKAQMPQLASCLAYWVFDVGVVRRFLRTVLPHAGVPEVPLSSSAEDKKHRALDDVLAHIAEARSFASFLQTGFE